MRPNLGAMKALAAFIRLSRLKFLGGGFIGGALGTAIAAYERGHVDWRAYLLAQCTITSAHLMTQYANEYYDQESDALTVRTNYSGGSGVLVDGTLAPWIALAAALACMLAAGTGVFALVAAKHALAGLLGALCVLFAWAYSAPPLRLLARGLGEIDTALVVAVLVPLCAYAAQTQGLDTRALATTVPGAVAMFAMMISVQIPDARADAVTGKRNLVVRLGTRGAAGLALLALFLELPAIGLAFALHAPAPYLWFESASLVPIGLLAGALSRVRAGTRIANEAVAGRGVALFAIVGVLGTLGYAFARRMN